MVDGGFVVHASRSLASDRSRHMQVLRVDIYQAAGIQISQVKVAGGILVHIFVSDRDHGARSTLRAISGLEIKM